ncbi:hypothetical protein F5I97DRAFT_1832594 [Phlebopus sp. FC_14]|nr:hypothetical protein F5I97DRAFT_1832594 [Phlebopus sp. FC_14]
MSTARPALIFMSGVRPALSFLEEKGSRSSASPTTSMQGQTSATTIQDTASDAPQPLNWTEDIEMTEVRIRKTEEAPLVLVYMARPPPPDSVVDIESLFISAYQEFEGCCSHTESAIGLIRRLNEKTRKKGKKFLLA